MRRKIYGWNLGNHLVLLNSSEKKEAHRRSPIPEDRWRAMITKEGFQVWNNNTKRLFSFNENFQEGLSYGDILSVSPTGNTSVYYKAGTKEIDIFITNHCNSNCIMCPLSNAARRKKDEGQIEWIWEYIDLLPENIEYVNITGGEPTLKKEAFLATMARLTKKFNYSDFQLLTNGRSCADRQFLSAILKVSPKGMRFAIPIHAGEPSLHDYITQVKGSFYQTDAGVRNLLSANQKVEIRVVVSKINVEKLYQVAQFITSRYKGLFCVNFIGMEMMGNAAVNRKALWVDYDRAFKEAKGAIDHLVKNGIDVQLYNFPLCSVDEGYWSIVARSITDYKIRYMKECNQCEVKEICGGFFFSTKQIIHPAVMPIIK